MANNGLKVLVSKKTILSATSFIACSNSKNTLLSPTHTPSPITRLKELFATDIQKSSPCPQLLNASRESLTLPTMMCLLMTVT